MVWEEITQNAQKRQLVWFGDFIKQTSEKSKKLIFT